MVVITKEKLLENLMTGKMLHSHMCDYLVKNNLCSVGVVIGDTSFELHDVDCEDVYMIDSEVVSKSNFFSIMGSTISFVK